MSTVILDTITGKSTATTITIGSTPVVSASANSMTIRGEGSNQTSIQQGLAKVWVNFDGTGTPAPRDSLNNASITDRATGKFTSNFTTNMANDDYSAMVGSGSTDATNRDSSVTGMTTSSLKLDTYNTSNTRIDHEFSFCNAHGDLA